jgi:hypothetical protein
MNGYYIWPWQSCKNGLMISTGNPPRQSSSTYMQPYCTTLPQGRWSSVPGELLTALPAVSVALTLPMGGQRDTRPDGSQSPHRTSPCLPMNSPPGTSSSVQIRKDHSSSSTPSSTTIHPSRPTHISTQSVPYTNTPGTQPLPSHLSPYPYPSHSSVPPQTPTHPLPNTPPLLIMATRKKVLLKVRVP